MAERDHRSATIDHVFERAGVTPSAAILASYFEAWEPHTLTDPQAPELLRRLRDAQRAALAEPDGSPAGLLLEGVVLRLQADLRWLESCERNWTSRKDRS